MEHYYLDHPAVDLALFRKQRAEREWGEIKKKLDEARNKWQEEGWGEEELRELEGMYVEAEEKKRLTHAYYELMKVEYLDDSSDDELVG